MNLCTSQTCRIVVLLFVIFLAGYLILTNSKAKVKEYFDDNEITGPDTQDISTQVSQIYKEVYFTDIPQTTLASYTKNLNSTNFDAATFRKTLTVERTGNVRDVIKSAYDKVNRQPTQDELQNYTNAFMTNQMTTKEQLMDELRLSPEAISTKETRTAKQSTELTNDDYDMYKKIIDTYQKDLDRLPNSTELNHYFNLMKTDTKFTIDKLNEVLLASREHDILEKNQVNTVQGDLKGNINERQIQLMVVAIYKSVYQVEPNAVTFQYLKTKFIEFELSEDKLINFVKQLKSAESSYTLPTNNQSDVITQGTVPPHGTDGQPTNAEDAYSKYIEQSPDTNSFVMSKHEKLHTETPHGTDGQPKNPKDAYSKYIEQSPDTNSFVMSKHEKSHTETPPPNSITPKNTESFADQSAGGISTEKILNSIRNGTGTCKFDRNKIENKSTEFSALLAQRNGEECGRIGNKYTNADEDLVLLPELKWQVPYRTPNVCYGDFTKYQPLVDQTALIGTLLTDANKTSVGSIMPNFTYKEQIGPN